MQLIHTIFQCFTSSTWTATCYPAQLRRELDYHRITKGYGTIQKVSQSLKNDPTYKLHNTSSTVLLLWEPTTQYPANLANTAAKDSNTNNCRIKHQVNSNIWRLEATRALSPGDEVLVPYSYNFSVFYVINMDSNVLPGTAAKRTLP